MSEIVERFVADEEAGTLTSLSKSQMQRLRSAGQFPRKIQITPHRSAYLLSELQAWIRERIAASSNRAA